MTAENDVWLEAYWQEFLDFGSGVIGAKILYESFLEIVNSESAPECLEELLFFRLIWKGHILLVLPDNSVCIADKSTRIITDIVVELENHEIVNLEIQKIVYKFPGERCTCYLADIHAKRLKSKLLQIYHLPDIEVHSNLLYPELPLKYLFEK